MRIPKNITNEASRKQEPRAYLTVFPIPSKDEVMAAVLLLLALAVELDLYVKDLDPSSSPHMMLSNGEQLSPLLIKVSQRLLPLESVQLSHWFAIFLIFLFNLSRVS